MKYRVTHSTELSYEVPVDLSYNEARLFPRALPWQKVLSSEIHVEPQPGIVHERADYFGNRTLFFSSQVPHDRLLVTVTSVVETSPQATAMLTDSYNFV